MSDNYYQKSESVEEYIKMAEGIDGEELIKKLHNYLPSKSTLLELGSGPGSDFQILTKHYQVVGSDFSQEFIRRLVHKFPNNEFLKLDAKTLDTAKTFDGIYSNKVLIHLSDDELIQSIKRQHSILNTGGIICHSFWKGEGDENHKGLLVNYQNEKSLTSLFGSHFELLSLEEYNEFENGDSLIIIGKKID